MLASVEVREVSQAPIHRACPNGGHVTDTQATCEEDIDVSGRCMFWEGALLAGTNCGLKLHVI